MVINYSCRKAELPGSNMKFSLNRYPICLLIILIYFPVAQNESLKSTSSLSFIVSIQMNRRHICTGVLITDTIVLTAGHCLSGVKDLESLTIQPNYDDTIHSPSDPNRRYSAQNKTIHQNMKKLDHDIGLIVLNEPVEQVNGIKALPLSNLTNKEIYDDDFLIMAAWGYTKNWKFTTKLSLTQIKLLNNKKCDARFKVSVPYEDIICAMSYHTKICRGDGGAPIFRYDPMTGHKELIGLLIYATVKCAADMFLAVQISSNYDWIKSSIEYQN